ncbi:uncharacterized protein LOC131843440 [Achroia grisella]|uniref:uncharacterized protein LOC131843440 n=1 Tax=Achroia grisella TaxID=688607 RepID=UPI0027D228AD|nr:uncharacterized protein LOC131843440 [Achroia grisella]
MYIRSNTYVGSAVGASDKFNVVVGLHQGSALSPYLFVIVMDALTSDIQDEVPWCMLFADDIVLVGEDGLEVQSRQNRWQEKLESVGLKISSTKTEYLFCYFGGLSYFKPICLNGVMLPVCSDFGYLGSVIQNYADIDRYIRHIISAGWVKWRQASEMICDPRIPLKLKDKVYKSINISIAAILYQQLASAC